MFPYIDLPTIPLGPLTIAPFGILVATGVLLATHMIVVYGRRYNMNEDTVRWLGMRLVVWGFIACHVVDVVFYTPEKLKEDPLILFKIWEGIASWGGLLGGVLAFIYYSRKKNLHPWRWADMATYGVVPGFVFGRLGCAVAHDHIGAASDFFLAVNFPPERWPGEPAHDLGLYEAILWIAIWGVIIALERWRGRRPGTLVAVMAILYTPPRFFFEFLRRETTDPRYLGLTFAQWCSIAGFVFGAWLLWHLTRSPRVPLEEPDDSEAAESRAQARMQAAGAKPPAAKAQSKGKNKKKR